ncbi:MAG: signal peptidase I [Ktedonobacterales bacterium]|nr:signal peptidase I [Ktedonobacterales bacterium]
MAQKVRPEARNKDDAGTVLPGSRATRPQPGRTNYVHEIIETIVLTAIVFFVVHAAAQPYRVEGPSMQPGLRSNEYVLVSPIVYAFGGAPQRGDVVVLHPPTDPNQSFIKRVIGLPGDVVSITPDAVIVDGKRLSEPYLNEQGKNVVPECGQVLTNVKVEPGQYLVLGDNRGDSEDSRCFGSVPRNNIVGKAVFMALPLNQIHWINTFSSVFAGIK